MKLICRLCASTAMHSFANLGVSPLANSFISSEGLNSPEIFYPLNVFVCETCFLVQLSEFEAPANIFTQYIYFSSFSSSWLRHASEYIDKQIMRFDLSSRSLVVEVASNDGYLLQYAASKGLAVLGIEPAANVAAVASDKGIPTEVAFFGSATATRLKAEGRMPDLMVANNVLAHVPDLHDFVEGFRILLGPTGVVTFEFPHLLRLIEQGQFDTIYHEHFSYLSLGVVETMFARHGLVVFDVEELGTHGGSLRVYACHAENLTLSSRITDKVERVKTSEEAFGLFNLALYDEFQDRIAKIKCDLLEFLVDCKRQDKNVVAYGAPAKGNTLLNYCGIGPELIGFTVDASTYKQGMFLPGVRIPIKYPDAIREARPDYVLVLPWNLKDEIMTQMAYIEDWGGRFVVAVPALTVL